MLKSDIILLQYHFWGLVCLLKTRSTTEEEIFMISFKGKGLVELALRAIILLFFFFLRQKVKNADTKMAGPQMRLTCKLEKVNLVIWNLPKVIKRF